MAATFTVKDTGEQYQIAQWIGLTGTETGDNLENSHIADKTVQISGNPDTGTVTVEGSMDGSTWNTLTYDGVNNINALGMFLIWENPRYIRPSLSGGGGSSDIDVIIGMSERSN